MVRETAEEDRRGSSGSRVGAGQESGVTAAASSAVPRHVLLLFASACGLSVANIYFAHPLLDAMARDLAIELGRRSASS